MQRSYTAARGKKFLPRLRKRGGFDFACDASLELGMKNGACSVNHDHVFCAFSTNRVRYARWNYDPDVVVAAMIIAFGKQSAVTLRMNFSSKNLHTWDPGFLNVALVSVRGDKFARLQASLRKPFSE